MTVKKKKSRNEAGREEEKINKAEHEGRGAGAEEPKSCSGGRGQQAGEGLWVGRSWAWSWGRAVEASSPGAGTVRAGNQGIPVKLG